MASSNKVQDPAAAALLAIEEALNLRAAGQSAGPAEANPIGTTSPDKAKERLFGEREAATPRPGSSRPPRDAARTPEPRPAAGAEIQAAERSGGAAPSMQPANDDRQSAGEILRAFQSRSNRVPAVFVAACSSLWVLLTLGYFIANRAVLFDLPAGSLLPQATLYLMTIVGPVIFFLVTAALLRRGQEMRLAARSMTEVAVRLTEPETIATGQMVTLSQAIRREVASMGDGIERALARASELETLVRSEVSNLERSYSDNERRVHSLVDELASERESILTNADRVRGAIALAHDSLSRDLARGSSRFAESGEEAAGRVTASLNSKGEEIKTALGRGRDDLVDQLSSHGNDLIKRLTQTGEEATASLAGASDGIARTLADRFAEMDDKFKTARETLAADLEIRGDALAQRVDATGTRIADTIFSRGENLAVRLAETSDRLHDVVAVQGNTLHDNLAGMSERIAGLISDRTAEARHSFEHVTQTLASLFDESQARLNAQFEQHGDELHRRFATTADATAAALTSHSEALRQRVATTVADTLAALTSHSQQLHETVGTFTSHTGTLNERLAATLNETFTALTDHSEQM